MAARTGKWSKKAFWLELLFLAVIVTLVMWHGADRIDFVIALLVGFVWGHRVTTEPDIFQRMFGLKRKCSSR